MASKQEKKQVTKSDLIKEIKSIGYHDIKELSPTNLVVIVGSDSVGYSVAKSLATRLKKVYAKVNFEKNTVSVDDYVILVKSKTVRGISLTGVENEVALAREINYAVKKSAEGKINVVFKHGGKTFSLKNVTRAEPAGHDTAGRKKADVIILSDGKSIPVSVKKDNAENWESADNFWGEQARKYVDAAVKANKTKLTEEDSIYNITPNIAIKADIQEKREVVFGSDILEGGGAVVTKTFKVDDFIYDTKTNTLNIRVSDIITTVADVSGPSDVWFLIRNERARAGIKIGYPGLRVLAIYEKRVHQGVVKISRNILDT